MIQASIIKKANQFPMIDILNHFGHQPVTNRGSEYKFFSPFREEKTPSFSVNIKDNVCKDFGDNQYSGDAIRLYRNLTGKPFIEVVHDLYNNKINIGTATKIEYVPIKNEKKAAEIVLVKPEFESQILIQYAQSRGISKLTLENFCYEIHYKQPNGKIYYGIGFQNDSTHYEIRSAGNFKACIGKKDISFEAIGSIEKNATVLVFEGFFNLMSYDEIHNNIYLNHSLLNYNILVLNSTSLVKRGIEALKKTSGNIHLYLDNDDAGLKAELAIRKEFPDRRIISHRHEYESDLNNLLITGK